MRESGLPRAVQRGQGEAGRVLQSRVPGRPPARDSEAPPARAARDVAGASGGAASQRQGQPELAKARKTALAWLEWAKSEIKVSA